MVNPIVDELVRGIERSSDEELIRAHNDFPYFCEYCFTDPLGESWEMQPFHYQMSELFFSERHVLVLAPRQSGKSSLACVALPLFWLMRNRDLRILIVSEEQKLAKQWLREIEHHMTGNERYISLAGDLKPAAKTLTWTDAEKIVAGRSQSATHLSIFALGVKGAIKGRRADKAILDDCFTERNSNTEHQRDLVATWFWKSFYPVMDIRDDDPLSGQVIVIGTPCNPEDMYAELARSGEWGNPKYGDFEDQSHQE